MAKSKEIRVQFLNTNGKLTFITRPIDCFENVEQLAIEILQSLKVGPIYWTLFGFRVKGINLWLAPCCKLNSLSSISSKKLHKDIVLELRMRFRPSSYEAIVSQDPVAFDLIFAQVRYDFINTNFSSQKKNQLLLDRQVQDSIALDMLRYFADELENDKDIKRIKPKDFIPHSVPIWQRYLLFRSNLKTDLYNTLQNNLKNSSQKVSHWKRTFVERFLRDICRDYGNETYDIELVDNSSERKQFTTIRVRYFETHDDSSCVIEYRPKPSKISKSKEWIELANIYSICYGSYCSDCVQIVQTNDRPFKARFSSEFHAKSFLSLIGGYYRLMRKWHSNFCRDVPSPDLEHLKSIKSHGPIGYKSMKMKISKFKKPGTFLVRRCMETNNRYLIDVLLESRARLTIDVDYDPICKTYTKINHSVNRNIEVEIMLKSNGRTSLSDLIDQIEIKQNSDGCSPLQLKHWLIHSEYDDCPALLLSLSKRRLLSFGSDEKYLSSFSDLPKFIPSEMLTEVKKASCTKNNGMIVRLAKLGREQTVIIKSAFEGPVPYYNTDFSFFRDKDSIIRSCYRGQIRFFSNLKEAESRLPDWIFIRNPLFAETMGIELTCNSLVQEFFPLGSLDKFLNTSKKITGVNINSISIQLAKALLFLQEKRFVHGKIRCHNIYIKRIEPLKIKLTDPLGTIDLEKDRAFMPPEYLSYMGEIRLREYDPGFDVWALGTTLWQIYNQGQMPPRSTYANTLTKPQSCPDIVWSHIESCWVVEPNGRATPQSIFRGLSDFCGKDLHNYNYVDSDSSFNEVNQVSSNLVPGNIEDTSDLTSTYSLNSGSNFSENFTAPVTSILDPNGSEVELIPKDSDTRQLSNPPLPTRNKYPNVICNSSYYWNSSWRIDYSDLNILNVIGHGSCGVVHKGTLCQGRRVKQTVAAKKISLLNSEGSSNLALFMSEFEVMKDLNHENIIKTIGISNSEEHLILITEYVPLGSLQSYIRNCRQEDLQGLPLSKYAADIAKGMEYLEDKKIVHRDLALRNILVKDQYEVKICDFGLAKWLGDESFYHPTTSRALPIKWYAPEVLESLNFTHKSDVWSFGVVLWEIYSGGDDPYHSESAQDVEKIKEKITNDRLLIPRDCPLEVYNLMLSCWNLSPEKRESFSVLREKLVNLSTK